MIGEKLVRFGISRRLLVKLEDMESLRRMMNGLPPLSDRQPDDLNFVVHQCVAAGDLVRKVHRKGLRLCAADMPLKFPYPMQRILSDAQTLEVRMHPHAFAAFERIRKESQLSQYSVLSWCVSCFEIIEAARLSPLSSRGPVRGKDHRPLWPDIQP